MNFNFAISTSLCIRLYCIRVARDTQPPFANGSSFILDSLCALRVVPEFVVESLFSFNAHQSLNFASLIQRVRALDS